MQIRAASLHLIVAALLTLPLAVQADNWGHWRGPLGNGVAPTAKPPVEFGPDKNLRWKVEIPGVGSGSPVVWGDKVFVTTSIPVPNQAGELSFRVLCFDRKDGALLWSQTAVEAKPHERTHETNNFASASPCTDGENVYAHFGSRGLFCYTTEGKFLWKRDFGDMRVRNGFGEGSSPTVVDDKIIVPWDHEADSALYALNKKTGEILWQTPRDEPSCWATPLIATDSHGTRQIVMNGQNAARGYDLETGKELWKCGGQTERPCASAVAENGVAYVGSGFRGAFIGAFDLTGRGDLVNSKNVLWTRKQDTPDVASPLLSQGRVYYYKAKSGQLTCVDAKTGEVHFAAARTPGVNVTYASPIAAGGHIYLSGREGAIVVIKDAESFEIVAKNNLNEGIDATPAAVDNELFVRGAKHLFCFHAE